MQNFTSFSVSYLSLRRTRLAGSGGVWLRESSLYLLLLQLFERTPVERLGYRDGANPNIRDHKFFERIDWTKLEERKVEPPFKPSVVSALTVIKMGWVGEGGGREWLYSQGFRRLTAA